VEGKFKAQGAVSFDMAFGVIRKNPRIARPGGAL
jgi:hypothetical protein